MVKKHAWILVSLCLGVVLQYLTQPVWALNSVGGYLLVICVAGPVRILSSLRLDRRSNLVTFDDRAFASAFVSFASLVALLLVVEMTSWSLFRAERYHAQLGTEQVAELNASLPPLTLEKAPLVSADMAARSAEKQLAEIPTLGSLVELGRMTKQVVKGELVWVGFLHHRGFWKWRAEGSTPGYVVVSAHDPSKVELVTQLRGEPLRMRYLTSAFFADDAARRVYNAGNRSVRMEGMYAELDDQGRPFYVVPLSRHMIGFSGSEVVAVATLDVQTGEVKRYALKDAPAWIDQLHPEGIIQDQVEARGHLVNGWFNPSDEGRFRVSALDLVYGPNGNAAYYVGLTSMGRDNGIIGFMLIDSRTKAVTRYQMAGATEATAEAAAEGVMPEKKYQATSPLPFMVNNEPTYAMALRDRTGIPRAYALVSIRNYQVVAVADTLQATLRQYLSKLSQDRTSVATDSEVETRMLVGTVSRISQDIRDGSASYFLMVQEQPGAIFVGNVDVSEELVLTRAGDKVELRFAAGDARATSLAHFDNLSIPGKASATSVE